MEKTNNFVGTSGYSFKYWTADTIPGKKNFYPTSDCDIKFYSSKFNMVELNCTFYKDPSEKTVKNWTNITPKHFKFLVKVSRYLTHCKKLNDWETLFEKFHKLFIPMKEKLLGYVIQLPPQCSVKILSGLLEVCKSNKLNYPDIDFFVEFRHSTWFCKSFYESLAGIANIIFVNQNHSDEMVKGFSPALKDFDLIKNKKTMFRCHGTSQKTPYCGSYSDEDLEVMASLNPYIVAFNNTDSLQYQLEYLMNGRVAFSSEAFSTDTLLPCAIADGLKLQKLL